MSTFSGEWLFKIEVDYDYHKASRGNRGPYGEPIEPDEGATIEINDVRIFPEPGKSILQLLSKDDIQHIEAQIWAEIKSNNEPDYE